MIFWRSQEYGKAKEAIAETGDGLGKDVIKHFLPRHAVPANDTLQNAIDSHYAERRQAAAPLRRRQPNSAGGTRPIAKARAHGGITRRKLGSFGDHRFHQGIEWYILTKRWRINVLR